MYFNEHMFNPNTVNPQYYLMLQNQIQQFEINQSVEVLNAVKAVHDLCEAVKKMDDAHQQTAFFLCLKQMSEDFHWQL